MQYVEGIVDAQPKILKAISMILAGACDRIDVTEDIKVYRSGTLICIDCKIKEDTHEN